MTPRLEFALGQIEAARRYTNDLLSHISEADWFRMPDAGVTHIGWQYGHLAIAQYRLALVRLRGQRPDDAEFIPPEFLALFGKGSTPTPGGAGGLSPADIRRTFDAVYARVMRELPELPDAVLDEPSEPAHPMIQNKLGALAWCAQHEFLHAGQIGLLRRLLGHASLR
jgi:hypothetical protein